MIQEELKQVNNLPIFHRLNNLESRISFVSFKTPKNDISSWPLTIETDDGWQVQFQMEGRNISYVSQIVNSAGEKCLASKLPVNILAQLKNLEVANLENILWDSINSTQS